MFPQSLALNSFFTMPLAAAPISAGAPNAESDDYELLDINAFITKGREGFIAYTVTGDSMCEAIQPGYIIFVDPYSEPKKGDVIASRVNGEISVKIFERNGTGLFLVAANTNYPPRQIKNSDDFHIIGVVKGHLAVY